MALVINTLDPRANSEQVALNQMTPVEGTVESVGGYVKLSAMTP